MDSFAQNIFNITDTKEFNEVALEIFHFQLQHNSIYRQFVGNLSIRADEVNHFSDIPFLPVSFFKNHPITTTTFEAEAIFSSSGTTGAQTSRHFIRDLSMYERSFLKAFQLSLGNPEGYVILGLLPSYLEQEGSSLVYMVNRLISDSSHPYSGFYLDEYNQLNELLVKLRSGNQKVILLGVTYALLDFAEQFPLDFPEMVVMETGGMKGRRREMVREEVHGILKQAFGVDRVHSEYGMTELLSQAYSKGDGIFASPPWMKILMRDIDDPLSLVKGSKTGGINVIDLANIYSCSFIATQDLGRAHPDGTFEVLGRYDNSEVRGCNLLV